MQQMVDTIFVQSANMTLLHQDSFLEYLKLRVNTWYSLRNSPLHHSALFPDAVFAKAEEDISKAEAVGRDHPPTPGQVLAGAGIIMDIISRTR